MRPTYTISEYIAQYSIWFWGSGYKNLDSYNPVISQPSFPTHFPTLFVQPSWITCFYYLINPLITWGLETWFGRRWARVSPIFLLDQHNLSVCLGWSFLWAWIIPQIQLFMSSKIPNAFGSSTLGWLITLLGRLIFLKKKKSISECHAL